MGEPRDVNAERCSSGGQLLRLATIVAITIALADPRPFTVEDILTGLGDVGYVLSDTFHHVAAGKGEDEDRDNRQG